MIRIEIKEISKGHAGISLEAKKLMEWKFYSWPFGALQGWCGSL